MNVRETRFGWALCLAALFVLAGLPACDGSGGGQTPPIIVVPGPDVGPAFAGLKAIATAGGGSVRLCWTPANDDVDAPSQIRYRVYAATTQGGQDFNAPLVTTAAGEICVTIQANLGVRTWYVVRALDTDNRQDNNRVELSITPLPQAQVVYVDDSAAGPGNGSFASPFTSLQDGVEAAEAQAAGGIVLVARGTYEEEIFVSAAGTAPIYVFGGFPDWASFGGPPAPAGILAAFNAATNLTIVDGTGLTPFGTSGRGLVHVENGGRQTAIGGFRITEADTIGIWGVSIDLEVSCCSFRDPDDGNVTLAMVRMTAPSPERSNYGAVVGSDIRDFATAGIEFGGLTDFMMIGANFIGRQQSNGDSTKGITMGPFLLLEGLLLDTSVVVVPTGGTTKIHIENNEIFRTNDNGIDLDFAPLLETAAGTLDIAILGNRVEFVDDNDGIEIDDFLYFGDGGSGTLRIENNRIVSIDDSGLDLEYITTQLIPDGAAVDGPTTTTIRGNWFALVDDGIADIDGMIPPAGGTLSFLFENNFASNVESTSFEVDGFSPIGAGPLNGRIDFTMRGNHVESPNNGDTPDLELDSPPGPLGLLSILIEDNLINNADDAPIVNVEIDSKMGSNAPGTPFNQSVVVRRNVLIETIDTSEDGHIDIECFVSNGTTSVDIHENRVAASSAGISLFHSDESDPSGPIGSTTISVTRNDIFSTGSHGIEIEADVTGGGLTVLDVLHNRVSCDEEAFDIEIESGALPNGRAHVTIFNNRIDAAADDDDFRFEDRTSATNGEAVYAFIANNTLAFGDESSGTEVTVGEHSVVCFANNFVGFGEVDSDDGLELDTNGSNPGLLSAKNNLIAYVPGHAVLFGNTNTQFVNNTVAFNSMGGDFEFATTVSAVGVPTVLNSILYRNGGGDVGENVQAAYTLISDRDPPTGLGNITGNPIFDFSSDLFAFKTNFGLRPGSPCIDAGHPDPIYNDRDGTRNNMGVFGGPDGGEIGSFLPTNPLDATPASTPPVPLVALGLARPFTDASTLVGLVDLHAGSPLRAVGPTSSISVVFSRPIDPATVAGIVVTANGTPVAGGFTLSGGGRVATLTPGAPVAAGAVVRVDIGPSVLAAGTGAPLATRAVHDFGAIPTPTPEAEPAGGPDANGTSATAQAIPGMPATLNVTGTLFTGDTDVYSFGITAGERLQATVVAARLAAPTGASFTLELLDTDGATVLARNTNNAGPVGGPRDDPFLDYSFETGGTYYLRVTASSTGDRPYELHWFLK